MVIPFRSGYITENFHKRKIGIFRKQLKYILSFAFQQ